MTQIARVTDLIGDIGSATREQSEGIGQVHVALTQLDEMTQQNAGLVEKSVAVADSLETRTQAVAVFKGAGRFPGNVER